jgi:hypothetical protein
VNLMDAVSTAHVLTAAIELGLIDQLTSGLKNGTECADACATDPSMTSLLLDALAGLGVARREALGRYVLAIDLPRFLRALIRSWSQLSVVVRNGKPLVRADTAVGASDLYPDCLPVLSAMFTPAASRAAQLLGDCGADVLDVGAGAAPWSIALATSSPAGPRDCARPPVGHRNDTARSRGRQFGRPLRLRTRRHVHVRTIPSGVRRGATRQCLPPLR